MARRPTAYQFVGTPEEDWAPQRLDRAVQAWAHALAQVRAEPEDSEAIADRGAAVVVE